MEIKWKDGDTWRELHDPTLAAYPVQHLVDMFTREQSPAVVIKCGSRYIVNDDALAASYRKGRKEVRHIREVKNVGELVAWASFM